MELTLEQIIVPSEDIVARLIEDDLIIVPLVAGIGDADDELYTLNETGKAIWSLLDGEKTLGSIAEELSREFNAAPGEIEQDLLGLAGELLLRNIVVAR